MKKYLFGFAASVLLLACAPESLHTGSPDDTEEVTITCDASDITGFSVVFTGSANLPSGAGEAEVGIMYDKSQSFEKGKKLVATRSDDNKFKVRVTGLSPSTTYYYKYYVQSGTDIEYGAVKSFTTKESHAPAGTVDLGVVMTREDGSEYDLYWAKSNLSADGFCAKPEDYGDYYAWGELEPKKDYSWQTYKWCNGKYNELTKYCPADMTDNWDGPGSPDGKTELDPEDDAAHVILGGKWRMPTEAEWAELRKQCTWTTDTLNGVGGRLVTGPNGNSIFLPAAGSGRNTDIVDEGSEGYYWSSSLYPGYPPSAWFVYFSSGSVNSSNHSRYFGQSVRPVTE